MEISINYRETLFDLANRTPIRGEPTFKTLHKLKIEIKENAKPMYSNLGGGSKCIFISSIVSVTNYVNIRSAKSINRIH